MAVSMLLCCQIHGSKDLHGTCLRATGNSTCGHENVHLEQKQKRLLPKAKGKQEAGGQDDEQQKHKAPATKRWEEHNTMNSVMSIMLVLVEGPKIVYSSVLCCCFVLLFLS